MNIFINADNNKELALSVKEELISICNRLEIKVVHDAIKADIICSIGGDGKFLESSRLASNSQILGINCGTLGFLTDVNPEDIPKEVFEDAQNSSLTNAYMKWEIKNLKQRNAGNADCTKFDGRIY